VPEHVLLLAGEDHLLPFDPGPLGDEDDRVEAGVLGPVLGQQLAEPLHVEPVLGDDAAVGRSGHGREEGGETGVAAEDLDTEKALMGTGRGPQGVGQADRPGDAGAEPKAVVGAGDIVVHGLGDGDDLDALLVKGDGVAQRVIAPYGDEIIDPQAFDILQDLLGEVVGLVLVLVAQMGRHIDVGNMARPGAGGVEEGAAGAADFVDDFFCQDLAAFRFIGQFVPVDLDQPRPAAADTDDIVALVDRPDGDGPDGRVEAGDVAPAGEDADDAFFRLDVGHDLSPFRTPPDGPAGGSIYIGGER